RVVIVTSPGSSKVNSPLLNPFRRIVSRIVKAAIDLVLPEKCLICGRVGTDLCDSHIVEAPTTAPVRERNSPLGEMRSTAEFGDAIQLAIHSLKYSNGKKYVPLLGQRLVDELKRSDWKPTLITAIPLHETRLLQRGYNQSALLGEYLAEASGLPFR